MCVCVPYIFSVCTNVVCSLGVVCTFGQPFPNGCTVCGCVVHLTAFKTKRDKTHKQTKVVKFTKNSNKNPPCKLCYDPWSGLDVM